MNKTREDNKMLNQMEMKGLSLLDSSQVTGNSFKGLKAVIDKLNETTQFVKLKSGDITLFSLVDNSLIKRKDGENLADTLYGVYLEPDNLPTKFLSTPMDTFVKGYHRPKDGANGLVNELEFQTKLALIYNKKNGSHTLYFISKSCLQTMDRFGISGECLSTPCLERDLLLAKRFNLDLGVTAVVRYTEDRKYKKIFTILSDKYTHINQNVIFDVIQEIEETSEMGPAKCFSWEVNNFFTKLYVEFPDKADELSNLYGLKTKMIPGILLTTSDTGDASFSVKGTWRIQGSRSVITNSEVKRKHSGDIDVKKLVSEVTNKIFVEYAKLPEALCNLMLHDITDPSWDLTTSAGIKANQSEIESVYKTVFKRLGITKAIGKKNEKELRNQMFDEINPTIRYTAYDICMLIMSIPERIVINGKKDDISALQKACGEAPYVSYATETVILTA
jgi:hypothetical protein